MSPPPHKRTTDLRDTMADDLARTAAITGLLLSAGALILFWTIVGLVFYSERPASGDTGMAAFALALPISSVLMFLGILVSLPAIILGMWHERAWAPLILEAYIAVVALSVLSLWIESVWPALIAALAAAIAVIFSFSEAQDVIIASDQ